jgi:hypothetical protein
VDARERPPKPRPAPVSGKWPNSEPKLRAVSEKLAAKFGTVLVIVYQPASIGALPLTVARGAGCQAFHLPGLAMQRIADLYPGEAVAITFHRPPQPHASHKSQWEAA